MTFEAWFRLDAIPASWPYLLWHEYGCRGWSLGVNDNGQVFVQHAERDVGCEDQTRTHRFSSGGHADGLWHHAVGVVERANFKIRLYVDGESFGEEDSAGTPFVGSGRELKLGQSWTNENFMVGDLDEARVSIGVRSADWVKLQYEAVAGGAVTLGAVE